MNTKGSDARDIFTTGTSISDSKTWLSSLLRQLREFREERRNPTPRAEITAESDPNGLHVLVEKPSLLGSIFSVLREKRPDHLEMTATPVEVQDIWTKRRYELPGVLSLVAHVGIVSGLIYLSFASNVVKVKPKVDNTALLEPLELTLPPAARRPSGGGGGGMKSPTPASKGQLPKFAEQQFVPPMVEIKAIDPELTAPMTLIGPTELNKLQKFDPFAQVGLPTGIQGPPSAGPGSGGGIGTGDGHGIGSGEGPGAGPGKGGGTGGDIYRVGVGGASPPSCPVQPEPNYSDDARKAHIQGQVVLDSIVRADGKIEVKGVQRSLGYGLDDEAKKVVLTRWRCNPGKKDGQAVAVQLQIVINFRLF